MAMKSAVLLTSGAKTPLLLPDLARMAQPFHAAISMCGRTISSCGLQNRGFRHTARTGGQEGLLGSDESDDVARTILSQPDVHEMPHRPERQRQITSARSGQQLRKQVAKTQVAGRPPSLASQQQKIEQTAFESVEFADTFAARIIRWLRLEGTWFARDNGQCISRRTNRVLQPDIPTANVMETEAETKWPDTLLLQRLMVKYERESRVIEPVLRLGETETMSDTPDKAGKAA